MDSQQVFRSCVAGMIRSEDRFDLVAEEQAAWVVERLAWHKLLPLAANLSDHRRLRSPTLRTAFTSTVIGNAIRERHYLHQAADVIEEMRAASLDPMPFKGPFWGSDLYPDYTWRYIGDIDLMMTRGEAIEAARLLRVRGYRPDVVGASEDDDFAHRGELTYLPPSSPKELVPVQLHWELVPAPRFVRRHFLLYEDFSAAASERSWKSITYRVPPAEVRFLYMALHGTCQHQFMRFVQIMDMAYLLRTQPEMSWQAVHTLAAQRRALVPVYYALRFLGSFWELPPAASALLAQVPPAMHLRVIASLLQPDAILWSTRRRGKSRRKLFRSAMSW